ncbi:MAG TPA: PEP-CTERM sorting domain-containing protein [Candidatus Limnocylindrales bacterium]|nr:PEP-CTERM sorting domain-containing protein [Candidatus Limnocylindrales bacterium]
MQRNLLRLILAAAALAPAASAGVVFSVTPVTTIAHPGDIGDSFDVVLTNNSGGTISVAAFTFGVSTSSSDISFQAADTSTSAPYIFAGDSFDIIGGFPLSSGTFPNQHVVGSDLTNDFTGVTVLNGQTVGLGRILYDVSPTAATGSFSLDLSTNANENSLSDENFAGITIDSLKDASVSIENTVPEPATLLLSPAALLLLLRRKRRS